ncbi:MAG: hypothetical protein JWR40_2084 [Massilia sp.]|nr:hypothetical protein [Massilia sp.]
MRIAVGGAIRRGGRRRVDDITGFILQRDALAAGHGLDIIGLFEGSEHESRRTWRLLNDVQGDQSPLPVPETRLFTAFVNSAHE